MDSTPLAESIAAVARDRLGEDTVIIDLRRSSSLADFFVVTTALSTVHAQAMAKAIVESLKHQGERVHHTEGVDNGHWVLLDYVDVVVHIFLGEVRRFYGFERLWGDEPRSAPDRRPGDSRTDMSIQAAPDADI